MLETDRADLGSFHGAHFRNKMFGAVGLSLTFS